MKNKLIAGLALLALTLIPHQATLAVERISAAEPESHCRHVKDKPEGVDEIFCIRLGQRVASHLETRESISESLLASNIVLRRVAQALSLRT